MARDRWNSRYLIHGYLCTGLPFVFVWPVLGFMVMKGMPLTVEAWVNAFLDGAWFKDLMGRGWSGSPVTGSNIATLFKHELWTFPGFTLIAASGLWMARDRALARVCLAQITLVFFFYLVRVRFNQGFGWGARYLMTLWPSFIVGCYFLVQHVSRAMPRALSIVFLCSGISLLVLVPARLFQAEDLIRRQIEADPCREMNSGELCIVVPRDGHSADNVRPLPFVSDGKMRVLARTWAEQLFAANALLKNPYKKKDAWAGSIWASGITPVSR